MAYALYLFVYKQKTAYGVRISDGSSDVCSSDLASGPIGSWDVGSLQSNSATLSRPNYGHYTDTPEKVAAITERLFKALADGVVTPEVCQRFPLGEAAAAHRALEGRRTLGSTILLPGERR